RRKRLEPRRPTTARLRDGLPRPRLLARVQPRGHVHRGRRRSPVPLVRGGRPLERRRWHLTAFAFLTPTLGGGWTRSWRSSPRLGHVRSRSVSLLGATCSSTGGRVRRVIGSRAARRSRSRF